MSDEIWVMGLVTGTHYLEDIRMTVPDGVITRIPGDTALRSKDLWRAIAQKFVRQVKTVPAPAKVVSTPEPIIVPVVVPPVPDKHQELEAKTQALEAENKGLRDILKVAQDQQQKLDAILAAIQGGLVARVSTGAEQPAYGAVDMSAPQFIPSEIKPKDVDSHIEEKTGEQKAGVSGAADILRKLKAGRKA